MTASSRRQDQLVFAPLGVIDLGPVGKGGSGSHYLAIDGQEYVGKCPAMQNGVWVCFNEFLAGRLAARLELPIPEFRVVQFQGPLAVPAQWFCSRRIKPGDNPSADSFTKLVNVDKLGGVIVFDVWLCNTDRSADNMWAQPVAPDRERLWMIDHGHTLLTSAALADLRTLGLDRILRYRQLVDAIVNINALGNALAAVEALTDAEVVEYIQSAPEAWVPDRATLSPLADFLLQRKGGLRSIIEDNLHRFPKVQRES